MATLITEQGTILDRIDYNIEQTDVRVKEAAKAVQKAERCSIMVKIYVTNARTDINEATAK